MRTLFLASIVMVAAVGCNTMPDNPGDNFKKPTASTFDDQIAKVKADPSLSEDAKAQAIKGIEMSRAMSQGSSQGAGKAGGN
jgi:hypothetical protein